MIINDWATGEQKRYDLIYPMHFISIVNADTEVTEGCFMISADIENWGGKGKTVKTKVFPVFSTRYTAMEYWADIRDDVKETIFDAGKIARFSCILDKKILEALVVACMKQGAEAVIIDAGMKRQVVIQPNLSNAEIVVTHKGESTSFKLDQSGKDKDE